jgi:putative methionine-R-sulfoxide reductase with GAF domain
MYDPIVVDTFVNAFAEIAPAATRAGEEARSMLMPIGAADISNAQVLRPLWQIRASASETALLSECRQNISRASNLRGAFDAAVQCLRQLTPASVFAMYLHHPATDNLTCEIAAGDTSKLLDALSIKLGQKMTGWSAANRRTSINADACLDLGQISELFQPPLRSTISTPLVGEDRLLGVLTAYSTSTDAFNDAHQCAFEQVAIGVVDSMVTRHSPEKPSNVAPFLKHRS